MKYLIASDIHGSAYYAQKLLDRFVQEKAQRLILLGDLYYHGPRNPFPKDYSPMETAALLNKHKDIIIAVRGNCDSEVDQYISEFAFRRSARLEVLGAKVLLEHGHKHNLSSPPKDFDVFIYGHEHTGYIKRLDGKLFVNCGSVALPKNNTSNSYAIMEDEIIIKTMDGKIILREKIIE